MSACKSRDLGKPPCAWRWPDAFGKWCSHCLAVRSEAEVRRVARTERAIERKRYSDARKRREQERLMTNDQKKDQKMTPLENALQMERAMLNEEEIESIPLVRDMRATTTPKVSSVKTKIEFADGSSVEVEGFGGAYAKLEITTKEERPGNHDVLMAWPRHHRRLALVIEYPEKDEEGHIVRASFADPAADEGEKGGTAQ